MNEMRLPSISSTESLLLDLLGHRERFGLELVESSGGTIKRGSVYGKSDATASSPVENPVHPTEVLATVYHSLGIPPDTIIYNHLNQPRELVKAKPVLGLFG